jgi:hypothetical protein
MIDRELAETLVALALIVACAVSAIATAQPPHDERSPRPKRKERRPRRRDAAAAHATSAAPATTPVLETAAAPTPPAGRARPRILTGEPAAPEPHRPAARRAITLVGGITALAAGGALGLLVLVRALVSMFERIGG